MAILKTAIIGNGHYRTRPFWEWPFWEPPFWKRPFWDVTDYYILFKVSQHTARRGILQLKKYSNNKNCNNKY